MFPETEKVVIINITLMMLLVFQVSYNAAGVLAHIVSDGPESWKIKEPNREEVLNRISNAIHRWDLDSKRNINYRQSTTW